MFDLLLKNAQVVDPLKASTMFVMSPLKTA